MSTSLKRLRANNQARGRENKLYLPAEAAEFPPSYLPICPLVSEDQVSLTTSRVNHVFIPTV